MSSIPKLLICITLIALTFVRAEDNQMTVKDIVEALISFSEECDPKPKEEHITEVVKNVVDAQYISKCFRHCLMKQFEMIKDDSLIMEKEKTLDLLGSMYSERKDELGEIIDECNKKNQAIDEKCENAHAHGMCTLTGMKDRGFEIPELKDE